MRKDVITYVLVSLLVPILLARSEQTSLGSKGPLRIDEKSKQSSNSKEKVQTKGQIKMKQRQIISLSEELLRFRKDKAKKYGVESELVGDKISPVRNKIVRTQHVNKNQRPVVIKVIKDKRKILRDDEVSRRSIQQIVREHSSQTDFFRHSPVPPKPAPRKNLVKKGPVSPQPAPRKNLVKNNLGKEDVIKQGVAPKKVFPKEVFPKEVLSIKVFPKEVLVQEVLPQEALSQEALLQKAQLQKVYLPAANEKHQIRFGFWDSLAGTECVRTREEREREMQQFLNKPNKSVEELEKAEELLQRQALCKRRHDRRIRRAVKK